MQEKYTVRLPAESEETRFDHYGHPAPRIRKDSILIISLSESACAARTELGATTNLKAGVWLCHPQSKTTGTLCETRGSEGREVRDDRRGLQGPD